MKVFEVLVEADTIIADIQAEAIVVVEYEEVD